MNMSENNANTGKYKLISGKNNSFFANNRMMEGSSIPTEGTFMTGDIIVNNGPDAADEPMWICNEGGTPGVWSPISSASTSIVPSHALMMQSKAAVGSIFYVLVDEGDPDAPEEPGFYIVTSIKEVNGKKVPATVDKINKKESSVPSLTYDAAMPEGVKIYLKDDEDFILVFNFSSKTYGDGKYRVYRDGVLIKSWSGAKGKVIANLGPITTEGSFNITVTATDYLTIPAPETLSFDVIVGGLKLTSSFDQTLLHTIYEEGDIVEFPFTATVADKNAAMKLDIGIISLSSGEFLFKEVLDLEGSSISTIWQSSPIVKRGQYRLVAQAYTGENVNDMSEGSFTSNVLTYDFNVLQPNEIAIMAELKSLQTDNNTYFSVPFRITSKIANYFVMKGEIFKDNSGEWELVNKTGELGITTAVNITNYWSIGKLEVGNYKLVLKAYTVDGGVESLEPAIEMIEVVQSTYQRVEPIKANLIAFFDANDKRNNDEYPDVWKNSGGLADTYRIRLHDLNYNSNGWKHIDPSLADDDDGEMMLKFTGDSYGELMKVTNGIEAPYNPFSIFTNSGQQGLTIETAIRTRNIGEMNARVLTCMNSDNLDTPGVSISYDSLNLASDSQVCSLEFMEDEWVHVTFVIDNNIRELKDVGQENIEDMNPVKTIRIYINGVLCACNALKQDKFLDASGRSFPMVLNCCKMLDAAGNTSFASFGECEIKFIRIYNSYLKSTEVLNNYIAHIYEEEEQSQKVDKNDVSKATLPTVIFKRNLGSNNQATFGILNSITDKKMSKSTCVDCIMEFNDGEGNITVYENVDVYLQGTSSLQYPVKNYKIKCFNDVERKSKNKIVPPTAISEKWEPDNCYTLKCDYMEQSHKNNTPTARFYNQVIDKLGGESPAKKDGFHDAIDGFPCIVYYNDDGGENTLVGSFMFNIDKGGKELGFECDLYDESGNVVESGKNTCVSYEGTANASDTAGCFYKLEESIESVYKYYVEDEYKIYLEERGITENDYTLDQFKAGILSGKHDVMTFDEFVKDYDEIDYVMNDFEARYSFNEDDDNATYRPIVDLVNWVSDSIKAGTFKKDFETHLDLTYMLAYYLQMQVFTQVDNCGKNSMWDTWDGIKFYPRPYDMDTSMGLSNTGTETIRVDAEILPELSPIEQEGTYAGYEYTDTTTDLRYLSFNTKTSKLWNAFAKEFAKEIKDAYKILRSSGIYTVENILKNAQSITDDMIGEIYFNKDAVSKYLSQTNEQSSEYLKMLHGNRVQKYKKFLTDRIVFLDTVYDYMESDVQIDSINSIITLRSDALYGQSSNETLKCYLGISVYSPQYVTISVGSGQDAIITAYVGPESTYKDPDTGIEHEGTLFSFPIRGTDKEMTISGAGNIKDIAKIQSLNVRDLIITKAERILNLDLSYSSRMTALTLGNNRMLRSINCANSYLLGTAAIGQTLDLSKCHNLKQVDLSYTKLSSIVFPQDTVLSNIKLLGCSVKNIEIDGAEFLESIDITDCANINKFQLNRCTKMTTVDVAGSSIQHFMVTNCENVHTINVSRCKSMSAFDVTNSNNITTLNMQGNTSPIMEDLKLYSMYNLNKLIVSQSTSLHNIRLPKYLNESEAFKAANGEPAILWENLTHFDARTSSLSKIQYGSADVEGDVVDMSQLTKLTYLGISQCTAMTEIKDINYTGAMNGLFSECKGLVKISGKLKNTTNSIANMFSLCLTLNNIDGLTFIFNGVANASRACYSAASLKTPMAMKILKACGNSLTNVDGMFYMYECQSTCVIGTASDTTRAIPSNFFEFNTNISNANSVFACTKYTDIPGDLLNPMAATLQTAENFIVNNPNLKNVGPGLFKNKPALKSVRGAFGVCTGLTNYLNEDPNIFEGSSNITNTSSMFRSCRNLLSGDLGLGQMFYPLINLVTASYMFYECDYNFAPEIANGLLSKCLKLTTIEGLFQRCRKIKTLPDSLFRVNIGDNNTLSYLSKAKGVFAECSSMEGVVSSRFFLGAENITDVSNASTESVLWSGGELYPQEGFFKNTKITGYHETFLQPLTKVQSTAGMFEGCTSLQQCWYYKGNDEQTKNNTISKDLFINNRSLTNANRMFYGCTRVEGCIPASLFEVCKANIRNVSGMFTGCVGITGYNLDATDKEEPHVGISIDWFKDAVSLNSVNGFLSGCNNLVATIPEDVFSGCVNLEDAGSFINGCIKVEGTIPRGIFEDCRGKIKNVSNMFAGCERLSGTIPTGDYEQVPGIVDYKLSTKGAEGALQVVETMLDPYTQVAYYDVVNLAPGLATIINSSGNYYVVPEIGTVYKVNKLGLLSECINLETAAGLFSSCEGLKGAIPHDLFFTSNNTTRYAKLTNLSSMFYSCRGLNEAYVEQETGIKYLFSPKFFDKCPNVTNISSICNYTTGMEACELHPQTFDKQTKLVSANSAFLRCSRLTGGVTQLFRNSISTLQDARCLFAYTNITSVGNTFLNNGGTNRSLLYIMSIFQGCGNLSGTSPEFWNGNKFTVLGTNKEGYWGALAGCTKLSNYSTAQAVSANWITGNNI